MQQVIAILADAFVQMPPGLICPPMASSFIQAEHYGIRRYYNAMVGLALSIGAEGEWRIWSGDAYPTPRFVAKERLTERGAARMRASDHHARVMRRSTVLQGSRRMRRRAKRLTQPADKDE